MLDRMTVPGQSQPVPYGRMPQPDPMGRPAPPGRPERTNRPAQPAPTSFPAERHSTAGGQDAADYGLSPGYGIMPSAYGGDPSARGGPAPAARKRRTVFVIALVATLVLATGGGLAVWVLRDRGDRSAADSRDRWSSAWLGGAEEVWSLDAPAGAGGMSTIKVVKDKLIRVMNGNGSATITVFRLGDGTPEQLWEEEFGINETYWLNIWEGQIVVGNTLVNIDSQEHATAPWNPDASVGRVKDGVVACSGTTCELWTSMTDKKWETEIPASSSLIPQTSQVVGDHTLVRTSEKEPDYFFLDLTSGETVPVEGEEEVNPPYELADGWFSAGTDYRAGNVYHYYYLYEADGTLKESFNTGVDETVTTYPWSPTPFTLDQARAWLRDGDLSWAQGTYSVSQSDPSCQSIIVDGNEIDLGKDNSATTDREEDRGGQCSMRTEIQPIRLSGGGQIAEFSGGTGDESFLHLVDMTTGRASEPIPLGKSAGGNYIVKDGTLYVYDSRGGGITAYRPA